MSIYSGFGSRKLETTYNKALYHLMYVMQLKISKGFRNGMYYIIKFAFCNKLITIVFIETFDDNKLQRVITKLYCKLFALED